MQLQCHGGPLDGRHIDVYDGNGLPARMRFPVLVNPLDPANARWKLRFGRCLIYAVYDVRNGRLEWDDQDDCDTPIIVKGATP